MKEHPKGMSLRQMFRCWKRAFGLTIYTIFSKYTVTAENPGLAVVELAFNPSTQKAEADRALTAWSTE